MPNFPPVAVTCERRRRQKNSHGGIVWYLKGYIGQWGVLLLVYGHIPFLYIRYFVTFGGGHTLNLLLKFNF